MRSGPPAAFVHPAQFRYICTMTLPTHHTRLRALPAMATLAALLFSLSATAAVYMERDAEGNVTFTDRPSSEDAKPIKLNPPSTYQAPAIPRARSNGQSSAQDAAAEVYQSISISQPADDSPVRENSGNLEVNIDLTPALKPGHHIILLMDGEPVAEGRATTLRLQNVDRGTHTLQAQVVDDSGNVIITSPSTTFHMLRISVHRP